MKIQPEYCKVHGCTFNISWEMEAYYLIVSNVRGYNAIW